MTAATTHPTNPVLEDFRLKEKNTTTGDQWAVLGGVRFLMAFIVLVSHTRIIVGFSDYFYRIVNAFDSYAAVAAFFVISGYSIASSLQRSDSHFYARRFWRIYPVYVFSLTMSILAFIFFGTLGFQVVLPFSVFMLPRVWDAVGVLLFLQGICVPLLDINAPIWTIGIEVIYYAIAPMLQRCRTMYLVALIGMSSIIYGSRYLPPNVPYYGHDQWGFCAAAWLCFWLLGFELYRNREVGAWRWATLLLPVALICFNSAGEVLAPFTISAAMLLLVHSPSIILGNERLSRTLNYLGDLSYPIYLLNYPVYVWVWELFRTKSILLHITAVLMVSIVVLALIDKPLRGAWKTVSDPRIIALLAAGIVLIAYVGLSLNMHIQRNKLRNFVLQHSSKYPTRELEQHTALQHHRSKQ